MGAPDSEILAYVLDTILPHGGYVMAYVAFMDESYAEDCPIFAIGCYLFTVENARLIEAEWKAVLARHGVPYFHMADVNACKGIFEPLGQSGCDELARDMIALLQRYITLGVAALGNRQLFSKLSPVNDDVYTYCLLETMKACVGWLRDFDPASEVAYFFEYGHPTCRMAWDLIIRNFKRLQTPDNQGRIGPIVFDSKDKRALLQTADLLARQATKFVKRRINGHLKPRGDFVELARAKHLFLYAHVTADEFVNMQDPAPTRPSEQRDVFFRAMFRLPNDWGPRAGSMIYDYSVDFGDLFQKPT